MLAFLIVVVIALLAVGVLLGIEDSNRRILRLRRLHRMDAKPRFVPEDFEAAFGITRHDHHDIQDHLTWRELCERAADAANSKHRSPDET